MGKVPPFQANHVVYIGGFVDRIFPCHARNVPAAPVYLGRKLSSLGPGIGFYIAELTRIPSPRSFFVNAASLFIPQRHRLLRATSRVNLSQLPLRTVSHVQESLSRRQGVLRRVQNRLKEVEFSFRVQPGRASPGNVLCVCRPQSTATLESPPANHPHVEWLVNAAKGEVQRVTREAKRNKRANTLLSTAALHSTLLFLFRQECTEYILPFVTWPQSSNGTHSTERPPRHLAQWVQQSLATLM